MRLINGLDSYHSDLFVVQMDKRQDCYEEKGDSLAKQMEGHWAFLPMITQMIREGEKSGSMDSLLHRVAVFYEQELNYAAE
ncbi:type II secretion system F family protein [Terribacillus aidingensis]|uniref:type II secretion system F family protein n=1 Tax=Terribacillus aidingensis TaxID=586416 RepID=UPI000BE2CB99|nr:type II secretion system F family protein [Terribacillus aidingensis]